MRAVTAVDLPRPGPHGPVGSAHPRRPATARRTSTIDVLRPDGLLGPVRIDARARDLVTGQDGTVSAMAHQRLTATVSESDRTLTTLVADPEEPALAELIGSSVSTGFRRVALAAAPGHARESTLLNLLLDDLPVAALVGGFAVGHAAQSDPVVRQAMLSRGPVAGVPDLCAGWAEGGSIMVFLRSDGIPPVLTGPAAPTLEPADDPLAWHERGELTPHAVRRARMLDVWRSDGVVLAHSHFRDSHVGRDGQETVVHEYTVDATLDPDGTFLRCDATVRVLPWVECPQAAASAGRVVGTNARDLRERVRRTFTGTSTCTHLNDQLRSLEDVPALATRIS